MISVSHWISYWVSITWVIVGLCGTLGELLYKFVFGDTMITEVLQPGKGQQTRSPEHHKKSRSSFMSIRGTFIPPKEIYNPATASSPILQIVAAM